MSLDIYKFDESIVGFLPQIRFVLRLLKSILHTPEEVQFRSTRVRSWSFLMN